MRLRLVIPYIDKWPTALAGLTNPRVVPHALTNLFNLVDDIAFYAGDRSADVSKTIIVNIIIERVFYF